MSFGRPLEVNGKTYSTVVGGCGQAVYVFGSDETAERSYLIDNTEDQEALVVVPNERGWEEVAATALTSRERLLNQALGHVDAASAAA